MHALCINMGQISLSLSLSQIAECTVTFPSGKGSQEVSETVSKPVWNPLYLSICLSILFSLSVSVSLCLCASLSLSFSLHHIYLPIINLPIIILSQSLRCGSSAARNLNNYHIRQMLHWQLVRRIPFGPWQKYQRDSAIAYNTKFVSNTSAL